MRTRNVVFSIVSAAGSLAAQNNYYLPQVADGIVSNGSLKTTIVMANTGKTAATVTIASSRDDASPRPLTISGLGSNSRFSTKLGPGATRLFVTDGSGDGSAGAAVVTSDVAINVSEILSNADVTGSLLSESAAPAQTDQDLALEYMMPVDATAGLDTGVALYNPGKAAATVTLKLLDMSGQPAGSTSVTLGPLGRVTRFVRADLFASIGDFRGTLDISSAAKLAAVAVRRNVASPAYTLLPVVSALTRRVRFFLPQIADGPSASATLQTTFLLTNVSATTATVNLSLTGDDGSPLAMSIPGSATIAPGATVFLQTDGSSESLTSAAAAILSTAPLAVAAVVTAVDGNGAFVSDSALTPSTVNFQFLIPFDTGSGAAAGAVILNSGARPVTVALNLLDPDGKPVASAQLPIAAGARATGMIADFFPGVAAASGSIQASTGSPIDATLLAIALRQSPSLPALSSAPAVSIPWAVAGGPTPATVKPTLDMVHSASASIPPAGGALTVTDAKGNKFTLTLPPGALLNRETITMTAISLATGVSGPGLTAGVQLEPDGLGLIAPALLKIELAGPAPAGTFPIGWRGQAPGVYLNPPMRDPKSLTLVLTHFSGAGVGGFDLTSELIAIANNQDLFNSVLAYLLSEARQDELSGNEEDSSIDSQRIQDAFTLGFEQVVEPMMELATGSDDEDVMRCASTIVLGFLRQAALLGFPDDDPAYTAASEFVGYIMQRAIQKIDDRCSKHDFTAYFDMIGALRQAALTGIPGPSADPSSCLPNLEFNYTSEINGVITVGVSGTYDATISGKVTLTGGFTKEVLTQVVDPSKDLYTSFTLSGFAQEMYNSMTIMVNNVPSGCSVTVSKRTPDTMTVKTGADPMLSQMKFKFNSHYDPQALTAKGQQLCSFCPVYQKVPVEVDLWVDPGKPSETLLATCPGGSQSIPGVFWYAGWSQNHASAGDNGYIQNWDLQADTFSASKNISETYVSPAGNFKEKTTLMLKPATQ